MRDGTMPRRALARGLLGGLVVAALVAMPWLPGAVHADDEAPDPAAFPKEGLLPKASTGVDRFLARHPGFNGRGVRIAIFDTGVDPGAPGLQITPEGEPKILDLIDGTGAGDVDMQREIEAEDGVLEGLSGRRLTLDPAWKNPSGRWRVGLKAAYDFFPRALRTRMERVRGAAFMEKHRRLQQHLRRQRDAGARLEKDVSDLGRRLRALDALAEDYKDPGPIYDCVVFHDGTRWRAVVDVDEDGDLAEHEPMTDFRHERQWSTFGEEDRLNFSVNIYDGGRVLSLVTNCGAHGTHVASIVAAHHPEDPVRNGIAPGAQIVGVTIGDARLGSQSLGTGEERGAIAALQHGCQLINMSYGGSSGTMDAGTQSALFTELDADHRVLFVASAGNDGPCLQSVGSPGGTTSSIFGIGAWLTPEMMAAQRGLRERVPSMPYTWSAQGPTPDGAYGVEFAAPGGAITSVPTWSLQPSMEMSGTSMAAPNACGGMALLVSAMLLEGIEVTPERIRRALAATAVRPEGMSVTMGGHGLVQIDKAWEHLRAHREAPFEDIPIEVRIRDRGDARGVVLRDAHETRAVHEVVVGLEPRFPREANNGRKLAYEIPLRIESTASWVDGPDHLMLTHGGRALQVRVDPTRLGPGLHQAEVQFFDARHPRRGVLARLPVTVMKSAPLGEEPGRPFRARVRCDAGSIHRRFLAVPEGATWMDLRVRSLVGSTERTVVLQAQQIVPQRASGDTRWEEYIDLAEGELEGYSVAVEGGRLVEVVLAQYFTSLEPSEYALEVDFHGLVPSAERPVLDGSAALSRMEIHAPLREESLEPSIHLGVLRRAVRPQRVAIAPLDPRRDTLPRSRLVHELVMDYAVDLDYDWDLRLHSALATEGVAWDAFTSLLWQVFDANDAVVASGTVDGSKISLPEGEYVVRLQVRHTDAQRLRAIDDAVLFIDLELDEGFDLEAFETATRALTDDEAIESLELARGARRAIFWRHIPWDDLPSVSFEGDVLLGTMKLGLADVYEAGGGQRPGGFPVAYRIPPDPPEDAESDEDEGEDESSQDGEVGDDAGEEPATSPLEVAEEAILAAVVSEVERLREDGELEAAVALAASWLVKHEGHLPLLVEQMRSAWDVPWSDEGATRLLATCEAVLDAIDEDAFAAILGRRSTSATATDKAEAERDAWCEALYKRARTWLWQDREDLERVREASRALARWVDLDAYPYDGLTVRLARAEGRYGSALVLALKRLDEKPLSSGLWRGRERIFKELGWTDWWQWSKAWRARRFPEGRPLR